MLKIKLKGEMSLEIREAVPADAAKCADIHMKSWVFAYQDCVPMEIIKERNAKRPAMWKELLENNKGSQYVVTEEGRIIGIVGINPPRDEDLPEDVYELGGLYMDPGFVGKGAGKFAMDWVKKEIASRGYRAVSLWVLDKNVRAKAFYERNGFRWDGTQKDSGLGEHKIERYIYEYTTA